MRLETKINIAIFLCMLCPVLVGAIFWLSDVSHAANEAKTKVIGIEKLVYEIHERVIRIENAVNKKGK